MAEMESIRSKVVLVDDNMSALTIGRNMLKTFYEVYPAPSAAKLFEILENVIPDLILLDIAMPEMNGYETIKKLKADARFADIPVIFLTANDDQGSELEGFDLGAADYVSKPFYAPLLIKRIESQVLIVRQRKDLMTSRAAIKEYADGLEEKVREKTKEVLNLQSAVLTIVADMVEIRDKLTGRHTARTKLYVKAMIEEMKRKGVYQEEISKWNMNFFLLSVQLHDVGKISITDLILNKQDKLTDEEFEIIKTHVENGVDTIEKIISVAGEHDFLRQTLYIVGTHHEKWDGSGYPVGLKGMNIPLEGRLMAIADVYDALISERSYKKPFAFDDARKIIHDSAGIHFDPALVDVFLSVSHEFSRIAHENQPDNMTASPTK
jgi:putative two-component system response regulator